MPGITNPPPTSGHAASYTAPGGQATSQASASTGPRHHAPPQGPQVPFTPRSDEDRRALAKLDPMFDRKRSSTDSLSSFLAAREAYGHSVLYHGTTATSKARIQREGFETARKTHGASAALANVGMTDPDSSTHHYFTPGKAIAQEYATLAQAQQPGSQPALVRVIGNFDAEPDPQDPHHALRTGQDVPPPYVLGSHRSVPTPAQAHMFLERLVEEGVRVNAQDAGKLLQEAQSDSDRDF